MIQEMAASSSPEEITETDDLYDRPTAAEVRITAAEKSSLLRIKPFSSNLILSPSVKREPVF